MKNQQRPQLKKTETDFEGLVGRIQATSDALQQDALVVINRSVTARAWITGCYIVEYEQHGLDRAKYGEGLLKKLAARLNDDKFRLSSLKSYRLFFRVYPELADPVRDYLESRFVGNCTLPREIGQTLSVLLTEGKVTDVGEKSQTLSNLSAGGQILLISGDDVRINPYALFNRNKMTKGDNPPIGILMCTGVGKETAEYLAPFIDQQLFLSEYQLQLPAKEKFAEFLRKENEGHPKALL